MNKTSFTIFALLCTVAAAVIVLSQVSVHLWGGRAETAPEAKQLHIAVDMSVMEFGNENSLPRPVLKKVFGLAAKGDLQRKVGDFGLSTGEIRAQVSRSLVLASEQQSKNWIKIPLKFGLWFLFLAAVFVLMRRTPVNAGKRKTLYLGAIGVFGVILGSDPNPMGTVKDAVHLYATTGVVFPPRLVALCVFLLIVLLANKFICAWGCQAGALQDLVFRLNRNKSDTRGVLRQYKPPFWLTNSVRIAFFALFVLAAFIWATDIVEKIDPFKIYRPQSLAAPAWLFIGALLVAGLFVYRPWCQFCCPFGLAGWLVEKISLFRIKVDYETCIGCEACEKACPSTVMHAILKRDRIIPDCFACGTCISACPTGAIRLGTGRRDLPPAGKFTAGPDHPRITENNTGSLAAHRPGAAKTGNHLKSR